MYTLYTIKYRCLNDTFATINVIRYGHYSRVATIKGVTFNQVSTINTRSCIIKTKTFYIIYYIYRDGATVWYFFYQCTNVGLNIFIVKDKIVAF